MNELESKENIEKALNSLLYVQEYHDISDENIEKLEDATLSLSWILDHWKEGIPAEGERYEEEK